MYFTPFPEDELIRKLCYMKCENGRLIKDTEGQIDANTNRLDEHDEEMADMKKQVII
uniref:Uncharacterized protein n=1 Tax=Meloidogyne enterolobii TaxID=390850 RepID=A0A6V7VY92_MELEN|nr:unnamed protein product [Meloidogyne enterolobii]